jgi:chorismate dehydratase
MGGTKGRRPVLAVVSYLNARPLIDGLAADCELVSAVPSECWSLVLGGRADLGLVPAIGLGEEPGLAVVPGIAIGSQGPVRSVLLAARRPLDEVNVVAVDRSSRTSIVLLQLLLAQRYRLRPRFVPMAPDWEAMLARHDAALVIGDPALELAAAARRGEVTGVEGEPITILDLGTEWSAWTELPFVFAVWAGRRERVTPEIVDLLTAARERGLARIDAIAAAGTRSEEEATARRRYLTEAVRFGLGPEELAGLERFLGLAAEERLLAGERKYPEPLVIAGEPELAEADLQAGDRDRGR